MVHPAIAALLIPHQPDELRRLRASLKADGLICPLVVWPDAFNDVLLDGHARLALCRELGIVPHIHKINLPNLAAAKRWVVNHQLARRNLGRFQSGRLAKNPKRIKEESTYGVPAAHADPIDYSNVHKIKRVQKSGDKAVIRGTFRGSMTVSDAYRQVVSP